MTGRRVRKAPRILGREDDFAERHDRGMEANLAVYRMLDPKPA
jgi:hypothetical protein